MMATTRVVGLWRLPTSFWTTRAGHSPPCSLPLTRSNPNQQISPRLTGRFQRLRHGTNAGLCKLTRLLGIEAIAFGCQPFLFCRPDLGQHAGDKPAATDVQSSGFVIGKVDQVNGQRNRDFTDWCSFCGRCSPPDYRVQPYCTTQVDICPVIPMSGLISRVSIDGVIGSQSPETC